MTWMTRFDTHADLVNRMSGTLGVDLAEEMLRGRMPPEDLRTTVLTCMGCSAPGACARWLDAHASGSDVAPSYCRNKDRLEGLANA
jgi:hypothetical protein